MSISHQMEEISAVLEQADSLLNDCDFLNSCDEGERTPDITPVSPMSSSEMLSDDSPVAPKKVKKRSWKKPKDKPKRPLSAYNIFFQHEREKIITDAPETELSLDFIINGENIASKRKEKRRHRKTHGKIGFAELARKIAEKWKTLDNKSKSYFEARADAEKARYKRELEIWHNKRQINKEPSEDEAFDFEDDCKVGKPDKIPGEMTDLLPKQSLNALMAQSHSFLQEQMMHSRNPALVPRSHNNVPSMVLSYSGGPNSYMNNFPYPNPSGSSCPDYLDVAQQTFNMARSTLSFPNPVAFHPLEQASRRQYVAGYGLAHDNFFEPLHENQEQAYEDGGCLTFDPHVGMASPSVFEGPVIPSHPRFRAVFDVENIAAPRMDDFGNFMERFERE